MNAYSKIAILLSLTLSSPIFGATVSISNGGTPTTITAIAYQNSTLASGGIAAAGYFGTLTDAQVFTLSSDLGNIGQLVADFVVVGFTTLDSNVPNAGVYSGDFTNLTLPNASKAGNKLYSFLGNQATLGGSDQFLLWEHTDVIDAQDTIASPDANSLVLGQEGVARISGGTFVASFDPGGGAIPLNAIRLTAVPEPSTLLLSAFGVLGLLRRKR